ncbi:Programmed cell death protein 2, C-terminal [Artemisia annua]|uniref:Programmed cell death protein 2, C-terminal n=1 Tax=Artemisia annua TaxID=35608 RepID=A0A2U1NKJ1_ARTAN|nr:Programmed cell death protein 2, C-terminal [Artemisia annua]
MATTPTLVGTELQLGDLGQEVQQAEIIKGQVVVIMDKTATLMQLGDQTREKEENYSKNVASLCTSISSLNIKEDQSDGNEQAPEEAWRVKVINMTKLSMLAEPILSSRNDWMCTQNNVSDRLGGYSYGRKPLLATTEAGDPGRCELCHESRLYEMPPLLNYLQEATNNSSLENWNWMSLIVYTCSNGRAPASKQESNGWVVTKEAIVVQTEAYLYLKCGV